MCGFTGSVSVQPIDNSLIDEAHKYIDCRGPDAKCHIERKYDIYNLNFGLTDFLFLTYLQKLISQCIQKILKQWLCLTVKFIIMQI